MHVVIFEGIHWKTFAPLSLSRPVFMLATGMATLLEKQIRHTGATRVTLWVRPELAEFCRRRIVPKLKVPAKVNEPLDEERALLVSGRTLHLKRFEAPDEPCAVVDPAPEGSGDEGEIVRMAVVKEPGLTPDDALHRTPRWMKILGLPRLAGHTRLCERLWDLIGWNEESLVEDASSLRKRDWEAPAGPYHLIGGDNVFLGEGVRPQPGVVLDGSRGPVVVDRNAVLGAHAVLQGPCYVGPYAQVSPHAWIRPGTGIGMMCKVGGEVSNSIFFGYTNKSHEGFVGDSYVGKWVNLGAGTTTSNLKNTYGEIAVPTQRGPLKTGRRFLGALVGDHVKTAVGTRLMAGSYVGFASMVSGSAVAPRFVPSYTFVTDKGLEPYRMEKAVEVMKVVFGRRDRVWDAIDQEAVEYARRAAAELESGVA